MRYRSRHLTGQILEGRRTLQAATIVRPTPDELSLSRDVHIALQRARGQPLGLIANGLDLPTEAAERLLAEIPATVLTGADALVREHGGAIPESMIVKLKEFLRDEREREARERADVP